MFCRNCGFEIEDPSLTKCPECSCILSPGTSDSTGDEEAEEIFDDIDNILSSDDPEIDQPPEKTEDPGQDTLPGKSPEAELKTIKTDSKETPEDEKAFDLDFESGEQNETEVQTDKIPEESIINEPESAIEEDREDPPEHNKEEHEGPAAILETADDLPEEDANEDQEKEDEKTETIEEQPSEEDSEITDEAPNTENEPEEEEQEDNDADETQKTGPKKSAATPLLLILFLLIIAAGAGVFYLKAKQPAVPPVQKIKVSKKEDKILKSILKKEGTKPHKTKEIPKTQSAVSPDPVKARPAGPEDPVKTEILVPAEKPSVIPPLKNSGEPVQMEQPAAKKENPVEKKEPVPQTPLKDKKDSLENTFWTKYRPGKQTYYTLQISSMATRAYAESNLNRLKKKGYPAYIILTKDRKGQPIYKLRIGKYKTEAKAKEAAADLYKNEKMKHIIVNSNADIDL